MRVPFDVTVGPEPIVATAVHAGHDIRPELAGWLAIDDATRRREEDPYTDQIIGSLGTRFAVHRSRFEADLNRPRGQAVYQEPADSWGLSVWRDSLPSSCVRVSLAVYDDFYLTLAQHLDRITAASACLVLDVHSYNHRRDGPDAPAGPEAENPEVNIGTGWLDRTRWGAAVDRFVGVLRDQTVMGHHLDVRENVRFRGGHLSRWVAREYPTTACAVAVEFKKTFMDEWTDTPNADHIAQLASALRAAAEPTVDALVGGRS